MKPEAPNLAMGNLTPPTVLHGVSDTIDSYMEAGWFKRLFINPYGLFEY